MELIPILSTIILVATISTFILAIGAYILYKVRERKREHLKEDYKREVNAEVIAPAYPSNEAINKTETIETEKFKDARKVKHNPLGEEIELSSEPKVAEEKYSSSKQEKEPEKEKIIKHWKSKQSRFLKYTSDGYVPAQNDKDKGTLKWR